MKKKEFPEISEDQLKFGIRPLTAEKRLNQSFAVIGFDTETLPFRYSEIPDKSVVYNDLVSIQIAGERFADFHHANFDPGLFRLEMFPDRAFIFAHNLPFDLGALLGKDYRRFLDEKTTIPFGDGWFQGFIRDGNMSFAFFKFIKIGKKGKPVTTKRLNFFDTGNYFKRKSLSQIAREQFPDRPDLWKMKPPEYLGERLPESPEEWDYFEKYSIQDSIVTRSLGLKILGWAEKEGIRPKPTPAGFSSAIFLSNFLENPLYYGSMKQERFIWSCYYGGRFEAFGRGTFENVSVLDFNSLYPYSMTAPLPFYRKKDYDEYSFEEFQRDRDLVGWFSAKFKFPEKTVYPSLPVATHKLFFPLEGWTRATSHELRFALEQDVEIENFKFIGFKPGRKEIDHPLKRFVDNYYSRKLELDEIKKRDGDKFPESLKDERDLIKLKLNSLYGKFAERHNDPGERPKAGKLFYPPFASLITGKSREILGRAVVKYHSIYSDTDSIGTLKRPDKKDVGEKLGQLKEEIRGRMTIVRSKQYRVIAEKIKDERITNENYRDLLKKGLLKGAFHSFRSPIKFFLALEDGGKWEYDHDRFIKEKEGRKRSLIPRSIIPSHFKIKSDPDEKRKYWKVIPISRILKENTFSDPLREAPKLK